MNFEIKNKKEPFNDFLEMANGLMNKSALVVNGNHYRLTTLEFYYFDEDNHADIYCHKHYMQKTSGQWYFHGSGLDITFGGTDVYGGILIRGIRNLNGDKKYINGPLLCVEELFRNLGPVDSDKSISFCVTPANEDYRIEDQEIYYSRRVGLNEKIDSPKNTPFYNKPTDFLSTLKKPKKIKV